MPKAILIGAVVLLLIDPYTYGRIGGDEQAFTRVYWQSALAAGSICLLIVSAMWASHRRRAAIWILLAELALFVLANALYLSRDGWGVRMYRGYEGSPFPLIAVALGALLRVLVLSNLVRSGKRRASMATTPS